MNNYINILQDSIDTSVNMKIFKNREDASMAHIFKSKLVKINMTQIILLDNFNPDRLKKSPEKAYPLNNRPRGDADINSVIHYQKLIQENKDISPIWIIKKDKYILLDGAHRIVASYIENKTYIYAYIIIE